MQARSTRYKTFGFGVVFPANQSHKFIHEVAVKPWRAKRVLCDNPTRRENGEVHVGRARNFGRGGKYGVDGRIGMVETHRVDAIEAIKIVLIRGVISVPCDHVEWGVI